VQSDDAELFQSFWNSFDFHTLYHQSQEELLQFQQVPWGTVQPNLVVQSNVTEVPQDFGNSFDFYALYHQSREGVPRPQQLPLGTGQPNLVVQSNVAEVLQDFGDFSDYHTLYHHPQFQQEPSYSTGCGLDAPYTNSCGIDAHEDHRPTVTGFHCGCCLLQQPLNTVYQDDAVANPVQAPTSTRAADAKYFCTVLGCTRSFGRKYDLNRHLKTIHSGVIHWCPVTGCERSNRFAGASRLAGVGFKRLDKLRGHMKKVHNI